VTRGKIYDVVVDIMKGSPGYGKWAGLTLSEENRLILWVPPGFAHGFLALEDGTEVLYKTTREYAPQYERGILWNDPDLGIAWPAGEPLLSEKDRNLPFLREADINLVYGDLE
jgi:dTDP-4-dehydrorhamnose 3,5-epimerase